MSGMLEQKPKVKRMRGILDLMLSHQASAAEKERIQFAEHLQQEPLEAAATAAPSAGGGAQAAETAAASAAGGEAQAAKPAAGGEADASNTASGRGKHKRSAEEVESREKKLKGMTVLAAEPNYTCWIDPADGGLHMCSEKSGNTKVPPMTILRVWSQGFRNSNGAGGFFRLLGCSVTSGRSSPF